VSVLWNFKRRVRVKKLEHMTEPEIKEFCAACAVQMRVVASVFEVENPLFVLLLFNDPKIAQYVSNCQRVTIVQALREAADRLERSQDVPR
jgi:hypothetical protein